MKSYYLFLFFILLIACLLRFYNLGHIPPGIHGDEAEWGLIEQKVNRGEYKSFFSLGNTGQYFDFSILSFWTQGLFQRVFGETVFGIRSSSAFAGTLTALVFFFFSRLLFKNIFISLMITLALATSHWHIAYSRLALSNIWTPLFMVTIFYFFYKGGGLQQKLPKLLLIWHCFRDISILSPYCQSYSFYIYNNKLNLPISFL